MDPYPILFGGIGRVKLMRLFLMNPDTAFSYSEIVSKTRLEAWVVRKEIPTLVKAGMVKKITMTVEVPSRAKAKSDRRKKVHVPGVRFNVTFPLAGHLRSLLVPVDVLRGEEVVRRLRPAGKLRFVALAGFFVGDIGSRVDILIVGDRLKRPLIERALRVLEAEIGKELSYAIFETKDFLYRVDVSDKFVRDILDYAHEKAFNTLGGALPR
ncbi:MAG: hypothetical protein ACYC8S_00820 [Minisyncoccota bacterium]